MIKPIVIIVSLIIIAMIVALPGCEKEKIVESTEYVHDIEYVEVAPDTVFRVDTIVDPNQVTVQTTDTVFQVDTLMQYDTTLIIDTVEIVTNYYDTVFVTDTLTTYQCEPNEYFAMAALHFYCDQSVIDVIYNEFGINDGWVFYLSTFQLDLTRQSADVYDIYGFIDYWTPDWSGFYPFEFYWRMQYTGGDPANVGNWQMVLPPATMATSNQPGVRMSPDGSAARSLLR